MPKALQVAEGLAMDLGGSVRENYSGRGMFGKECVGIVCDDTTQCIEEAATRGFRGACTDSMGRRAIVYWPKITAETEISAEDGD